MVGQRMRNIAMLVEYCGSSFYGFQIQAQGPTVQGTLTDALKILTGEDVGVIGAGRTDSGVHAWGQVVNFHTTSGIPGERFSYALNRLLPPGLRIRRSWEAHPDFHACFSAVGKTYEYWVYVSTQPSALWRDRAWFLNRSLDVRLLNAALPYLTGEQDFTSFCASKSSVKTFVRRVDRLEVEERILPGDYPLVVFSITANGFLYKMVRNIIGTLVEVGLQRREPGDMEQILKAKDRKMAGATAPACGLYLKEVYYG